jgi:hypothetical protein
VDGASGTRTIELRLQRPAQLLETLDPAPFHEKSLDRDAHRYLLDSALELGSPEGLRVVIHLPRAESAQAGGVASAIHNHFAFELEQARRGLRRRMRIGRISLAAGLLLLAVCSLVRSALPESLGGPAGFLGEGLLILGWVALWRPVDVLLFERWESADERAALARLALAPVELAFGDEPE